MRSCLIQMKIKTQRNNRKSSYEKVISLQRYKKKVLIQWRRLYSMNIYIDISTSKNQFERPCNIIQLSNIWTKSIMLVSMGKWLNNIVILTTQKNLMTNSFIFKIWYKTKEFSRRGHLSLNTNRVFTTDVVSLYKNDE